MDLHVRHLETVLPFYFQERELPFEVIYRPRVKPSGKKEFKEMVIEFKVGGKTVVIIPVKDPDPHKRVNVNWQHLLMPGDGLDDRARSIREMEKIVNYYRTRFEDTISLVKEGKNGNDASKLKPGAFLYRIRHAPCKMGNDWDESCSHSYVVVLDKENGGWEVVLKREGACKNDGRFVKTCQRVQVNRKVARHLLRVRSAREDFVKKTFLKGTGYLASYVERKKRKKKAVNAQ